MEEEPLGSPQDYSTICIFCASDEKVYPLGEDGKPVKVKKELPEDGFLEGGMSSSGEGDVSVIQDQLRSIFILRNLLDMPEEKCCEYLARNNGVVNPDGWFTVCSTCEMVVKQCYMTYQEMVRLERRIQKMKEFLKDTIQETQGREPSLERRRMCDLICYDIRSNCRKNSLFHESGSAFTPGSALTQDKSHPRSGSKRKRPQVETNDSQEPYLDNDLGDLLAFLGIEIETLLPENVNPSSLNHDSNSEKSEWQPSENKLSYLEAEVMDKKEIEYGLKANSIQRDQQISLQSKTPVTSSLDFSAKSRRLASRFQNIYECEKCPAYTLNSKSKLEAHRALHKNGKGVPCPECGWLCVNRDNLSRHIAFRHGLKSKRQSKRTVTMRRKYQKRMNKQVGKHNIPVGVVQYNCDHCEMRFPKMCRLINHVDSSHHDKPQVSCDICKIKLVSKQLLKMHRKIEHWQVVKKEKELEEDCYDLSSETERQKCVSPKLKSKVQVPKSRKRKNLQDTYQCDLCPGHFATEVQLGAHREVHKRNDSVSCLECGWMFETESFMKKHVALKHHIKTKPKKRGRKPRDMKTPEKVNISFVEEIPYTNTTSATEMGGRSCTRRSTRSRTEAKIQNCILSDVIEYLDWDQEVNYPQKSGPNSPNSEVSDWQPLENEISLDNMEEAEVDRMKTKLINVETKNLNNAKEGQADLEDTDVYFREHPPSSPNSKPDITRKGKEKKKRKRRKHFYKCNLCPAYFHSKIKFEAHCKIHESSNIVPCLECGWVFETEKKMKTHISFLHYVKSGRPSKKMGRNSGAQVGSAKTEKNQLPYYCDHCEIIYITRKRIVDHVSRFHQDKELPSCNFCPAKLESKQLLEMHLESEHEQTPRLGELDLLTDKDENGTTTSHSKNFPCSQCSKIFTTKMKKDFHFAKCHSKYFLMCKICGIQHDCYSALRRHLETHKDKEVQQKDFVCELCSKQFRHNEGLKYHKQQTHYKELGLDPILCNQCGAVHGSQQALEIHMKHRHATMKEHCCEFCGKAFAWASDLKKHTLRHTAPNERHYKQGPFTCEFCQAQFNVRQGLYYHLKRLHSDKYDFRCEMCGKGYSVQNSLIAHQKSCKGPGNSGAASSSTTS